LFLQNLKPVNKDFREREGTDNRFENNSKQNHNNILTASWTTSYLLLHLVPARI